MKNIHRIYVKSMAFILAKLSHVFPSHVYCLVNTKIGTFEFHVFGLKMFKGNYE